MMEIVNLFPENELSGTEYFSIGIHPWRIRPDLMENDFKILEERSSDERVLAIGECGLDKLQGVSFELQKPVFEKHILLAEKLSKPLIIHCVKAYEEMINLKKKYKPSTAWIIHGFNKTPETAEQLVRAGFHLSFGANIKDSKQKAAEALKIIPENHFFLETDDSGHDIAEIYATAAEIRGISEEKIAEIIKINFEKNFRIKT